MKIFISHSMRDRELVENLASHLRNKGDIILTAEKMPIGTSILSEISAAIRSSDVFVAILSASPNTLYELGLATGANVPILVAARGGEPVPLDLASVPYVQLSGDPLRDSQNIARRTDDLKAPSSMKPTTFNSAEATLRAAVSDARVLESISPAEFERLIAEFFQERGFKVDRTPQARDSGVDLILQRKGSTEPILVEIKKYSTQSRVSVDTVRALLGAAYLTGATSGIVVSTSGYTAAAQALAAGTPIALRTLQEVLAAKSEQELLAPS